MEDELIHLVNEWFLCSPFLHHPDNVNPMIMKYQKNSGYSPYHSKGRVVNLCQCPRTQCKNHKEGSNKGYSDYFIDHYPEQGGHPGYRCETDLLFIYRDNCLGLGEDPSQG